MLSRRQRNSQTADLFLSFARSTGMGRASKYKKRSTATTTTNPLLRDEEHKRAHETVLPVVQSLKSASEKDRKWSTAIITELVQDDTTRLALLREGNDTRLFILIFRRSQCTIG